MLNCLSVEKAALFTAVSGSEALGFLSNSNDVPKKSKQFIK